MCPVNSSTFNHPASTSIRIALGPAVYCISLGCPKNRVDSEIMLASLGVSHPVEDIAKAEIVLVNTCGFIAAAASESSQTILEAAMRIQDLEPKPLLVVAGCLVSRYGTELAQALPEVDIWLGVQEEGTLPASVSAKLEARFGQIHPVLGRVLSTSPSFAYMKISEGCNHRCRFCTIPSIRGKLSSRPASSLLDEARSILGQGVSELVLVAQDVTSYGRDLGMRFGLEHLLSGLAKLPGLRWLRLMYLYPAGLTSRMLRFLAQTGPPLLPYFDLPLQHAHPEILSAMGRPFAQDPRRIVDRIRHNLPESSLRSSLIVGYPGERPHHFKALCDFTIQARFNHLGVFMYSREAGTAAARMPGQVGPQTKIKRRDTLMTLQAGISAQSLARYQDQEMDILVDRHSPEWPGLYEGRAWFQAPEVDGLTYLSGEGVSPGSMVKARIEEAKTYDLVALV